MVSKALLYSPYVTVTVYLNILFHSFFSRILSKHLCTFSFLRDVSFYNVTIKILCFKIIIQQRTAEVVFWGGVGGVGMVWGGYCLPFSALIRVVGI